MIGHHRYSLSRNFRRVESKKVWQRRSRTGGPPVNISARELPSLYQISYSYCTVAFFDIAVDPSEMPDPAIVIAGAGIAGLTAGRCLLSKGIRPLIVEKGYPSPRKHDYSIELCRWAYKPLLDTLGLEEAAFIQTLAVNPPATTSNTSSVPALSSGDDASRRCFRCHRGRLEALLQDGLEITWGEAITGVRSSPPRVDIYLENTPPIQAAVLIAADGVHSVVRTSFLPEAHLVVHPYVVLYGIRTVSRDAYTQIYAPLMQDETSISLRQNDVLLRVVINNTTSIHVQLGYTYSRPARLGVSSDPLFKPDRPNAGAKDIPEAFYIELDSLKDLEPAYAEIFDPLKVRQDRVLHWLMRSVAPSRSDIRTLADKGVVIIGDAVHAMPILGSYGANIAMQDGVELANSIAEMGTANIGNLVARKHQDWKDTVDQGVDRLEKMHANERAAL